MFQLVRPVDVLPKELLSLLPLYLWEGCQDHIYSVTWSRLNLRGRDQAIPSRRKGLCDRSAPYYLSVIMVSFCPRPLMLPSSESHGKIKTLRLKSLYSLVSLQSRDDTPAPPAPPGGPHSRPSRGGRLSLWSREQSRLSVNCPSLSRVLSRVTAHMLIVKSVPRKENHCRIGSKIGRNIYIIDRILSAENQTKYY